KQCGILQICMALVISAERRISSWRVFGHRVQSCTRSRATQSLIEQSQHLLFLSRSLVAKSELSASTCQKHGSLTSLRSNNSFKPTPLRYANHMAGTACHVLRSTTRRGLTQVLGARGSYVAVRAACNSNRMLRCSSQHHRLERAE